MTGSAAADAGCLLGALGAVLVLVPRARLAVAAGFVLLGAAEALLGYVLVPGDDLRPLVDTPLRSAGLGVAVAAAAATGVALARRPALVPVVLLVAAPFRVPVHLGRQEAFLLVPLYAVLAAAVIALGVRLARGEAPLELPRWLTVPAAAFVGLSALSLLWTEDLRAGTIHLLFFLFPFAALVACVARSPVARWSPRALAATVVALACGFAGVGLSQLWTGELYFARELEVANAYTSFFRTTSLFADSSIYGRELALAIVLLLAALWFRRLRSVLALPLVGLLWTALYFTYSQSSMAALVVAALALSVAAADRLNRRLLAAGTLVAVAVAAALVVVEVRDQPAQRFTSGRAELVENTWLVFADHPLAGVGVGAQPKASQQESGRRSAERNASHTTPLTVAAELGVVGLVVYAALLAAVGRALLLLAARDRPLGLTLAAAYLLLLAHSLVYSGFFENPLSWGILAVAAAALGARRLSAAAAPAAEPLRPSGRGETASAP